MINKIDFKAKNLTSNAGLFLLLEIPKSSKFLILLKMTSYLIMTQQINQDESYKDHALQSLHWH